MSVPQDRLILVQRLDRLRRQGYRYDEDDVGDIPHLVEFSKGISDGVRCIVRFDLLEYRGLVSLLKVYLIRRRLPTFPAEQAMYKPLFIDLPNLLSYYFRVDPFKDSVLGWEFKNETALAKQIEKVQTLILNYGMKWLEDPASDIDWVRQHNTPRDSPT